MLLAVSILFSATASIASAEIIKSAVSNSEKPCLVKHDANSCMMLGYRFMHAKGKNTKKLARYYFQYGCSIKMGRACSVNETKTVAGDFRAEVRAIASQRQKDSAVQKRTR